MHRVKLKIPQWEDMEFILKLWADAETMAPVGGPVLLTDEQARRWFERMADPGNLKDCYRLILNKSDEPVGEVSCHRMDRESMTGEFNIKVIYSERGNGYAAEAMRLFLDHFFKELGGCEIVDPVALSNHAGQKTLMKFGFEHDPSEEEIFMLRMTSKRYETLYEK